VYIGHTVGIWFMVPCASPNSGANSVVIVKRLGLGSKICSNGTVCLWACQERGGRDIMSEIEIGIERVSKVQECLNLPKTFVDVEL
jgi:hypothetical protein